MPSIEPKLDITIAPMRSAEDAAAFRTLNEEWITRFFTLEARDREILDDPRSSVLARGGCVYIVRAGDVPVGCAALIPMAGGVWELSKMAVSPTLRGQGIGRRLLTYVVDQARILGATSLFLGSSTTLPSAVHLYESIGFRHVPPGGLPPMPYARANVFMTLPLRVQPGQTAPD